MSTSPSVNFACIRQMLRSRAFYLSFQNDAIMSRNNQIRRELSCGPAGKNDMIARERKSRETEPETADEEKAVTILNFDWTSPVVCLPDTEDGTTS